MPDFIIDILDWLEIYPGLAAWIQVVGVLVALVMAILLPYRLAKAQRERETADRKIQAQGLAVVVHPPLVAFDAVLERAIETAHKLEELVVEPPRTITENVPVLWRMGPAGGLVLRLIGGLEAHRQQVSSTLRLTLSRDEYDHFFTIARDRLIKLRNTLSEAREQVAVLLDLPKPPPS